MKDNAVFDRFFARRWARAEDGDEKDLRHAVTNAKKKVGPVVFSKDFWLKVGADWSGAVPLDNGPWSKEDEDYLIELAHEGKTTAEMVVILNRSHSAVTNKVRALRRAGYDLPRQRRGGQRKILWTMVDDALIQDRYRQGLGPIQIAEEMGHDPVDIKSRVAELRRSGWDIPYVGYGSTARRTKEARG